MGIAKLKPDADPQLKIQTTVVPKETYKGVIADNNNIPGVTLQAYIDGMPWEVVYFRQLLGEHDDLRPLDVGGTEMAQQYEKYIAMEIKVATTLTQSFDSDSGKSSVTGSAVIPVIAPNIHDYFVSDAGSRQHGLYRITNVERRTFNRDSVYLVDYQLVGYVSGAEDAYAALNSRVVRSYRFSKKRLLEGLSPILRLEEYELIQDFEKIYHEIVSEYMVQFMNRNYMTIVLPGQEHAIYDCWLADFFYSLVDPKDSPEIRNMRVLSLEHDRYLKQGSIFRVLAERRYDLLPRVNHKAFLVPREVFHTSTFIKGPVYWAVKHYVYPKTPDLSNQVTGDPRPKDTSYASIIQKGATLNDQGQEQSNYIDSPTGALRIAKPVLIDDYYVLSEAFYNGQPDLSVLEILVKDYLKSQTLDFKLLSAVVNRYHHWPQLEKFYYGPIIMLLLKTATEGLYL